MRNACLVVIALSMTISGSAYGQQSADGLLAPVYAKREATSASDAKNWADAELKWEKATSLNPTDANAWLELGRARYYLKKYVEAVEPLQKADDLGVSYPWDMPYFQACCYALGGKTDDAMSKLQEAIDKGFRDLRMIPTDDDLKSIRDLPKFQELTDSDDISKLDRTQGIIHDIRFYERELKRLDYRERNTKDSSLDAYADQFANDAPNLTDNQVTVHFMRMAAMMGDGHTSIYPAQMNADGLPVAFTNFQEGTFITATRPDEKDLLGSKLVSIDGNSVAKLMAGVGTLVGRENDQWLLVGVPRFLRKPRCLNGLGLAASDKQVALQLEKDGKTSTVILEAKYEEPSKDWARLSDSMTGERPLIFQNRDKFFWYKYLPEPKTLYFAYNGVSDDPKQTIADFAKEMFAFVDSHDVDRMIVDTRFNGGGNNFLNMPLVLGLAQSKVNKPGHLFVIIGRDTFSAAMCFVTQVERYTNAIFAGEPTGSAPNFIGESIKVNLRYAKMQGTISDLYWQNSVAMDHRVWISPEIYVPSTFAAYASNRDPVFDAVIAYKS